LTESTASRFSRSGLSKPLSGREAVVTMVAIWNQLRMKHRNPQRFSALFEPGQYDVTRDEYAHCARKLYANKAMLAAQ
jgi:hypothetical protein